MRLQNSVSRLSPNVQILDKSDADRLKKLGVVTPLDLALQLPHSYEDTTLTSLPLLNQTNTVQVTVLSTKQSPKVFQIRFYAPVWQREFDGVIFAAKAYQKALFQRGKECFVTGKLQKNGPYLQMVHPKIITEVNTILPKYKSPFQNKTLIGLMQRYLTEEGLCHEGLTKREAQALMQLHFPKTIRALERDVGLLKFVEIYHYLKKLLKKKIRFASPAKLIGDEKPFIASLPFTLTADQQTVIAQIKQDFLAPYASKRVVMGDVGCGKTMVILACVMMAYPHKAILMAPTTVLAVQLYEEARNHLPSHIRITLVTQESKEEASLEVADFIIGTHALLYRELPVCALVMVDEQHRFGTKQRSMLSSLVSKQAHPPHFLQFSATPIPRTLSMIQSSLVDFSFIKMLPYPKDITTRIVGKENFKTLLLHLKEEISKGHQCIIVYPLVEESEAIHYQSIDEGRAFWEKNFENVYVTYGKDKRKEETLKAFKDQGSLLISTTVVEVGISLPKLSTIVIVGAERLGLASLHQLRGRVSRNGLKGYCYLYTNLAKSERLEAFSRTLDGFEIAELDLKFRHGGDMVEGGMQSGKSFTWFDMAEDEAMLQEAKKRVEETKEQTA